MVKKLLVVTLLVGSAEFGLSEVLAQTVAEIPFKLVVPGPTGGGTTLLLKMPDVHEELAMSDQQLKKLSDALRTIGWERRELFQNLVAGKVFEEPIDKATLRQLLDIFNKQSEESITGQILSSLQQRRLRQLLLQLQGVAAMHQENVARSLNLTQAQRDAVAEICGLTRPTKMTLGTANSQTLTLLDDAQRARWQAMQGEPFAFNLLCRQMENSLQNSRPDKRRGSSSLVAFQVGMQTQKRAK